MTTICILTGAFSLVLYTTFIIQVCVVLFVAAIYGLAYRFLGHRFYLLLAVGWMVNVIYLGLEGYLLYIRGAISSGLTLQITAVGLGLASNPFFHRAVHIAPVSKRAAQAFYKPFLLASLFILLCVASAVWAREMPPDRSRWVFAAVTLPAALYSTWVLMSVAKCFHRIFPDDEYGLNSRFLYGSWGLYGVLQLFYPLKLFDELESLMHLLFQVAFILKLSGSVALLNLLRESYAAAQVRLQQSSVLSDLGDLAAGMHHDIANPLSRVDAEIELLASKRHGDEIVQQAIASIRKPLRLIHSAIQFVDFVRQDPEATPRDLRRTSARAALALAISIFKKRYPQSGLRVIPVDAGENTLPDFPLYYVLANPGMLSEAFLNIIKNAFEAGSRLLKIQIRRSRLSDDNTELLFLNNGRLLSEEELKNCFRPGWSTKEQTEDRANIGMGLYMCSKIVQMHRGTMSIKNREDGAGVIVSVTLPAARRAG